MGDNGNELNKEQLERKPIILTITFNPDGRVTLSGPLHDRVLCYGLLEMAREVIYDFKNAQKIDLVKPTSENILDLIKRK